MREDQVDLRAAQQIQGRWQTNRYLSGYLYTEI